MNKARSTTSQGEAMPDTLSVQPAAAGLFAHSLPGRPESDWEELSSHARGVGEVAGGFADRFGAREAARLAGHLHDIGKVSAAFQAYIRGDGPSPDHSTAGAVVADGLFADGIDRLVARLVAFAVAGHHAGLADGADLVARLARDILDHDGWQAVVPPPAASIAPRLAGSPRASAGYRLALLGRMIFSCLVDADFLETERFYAGADNADVPRGGHAPLDELRRRLDDHLAGFAGRPGELNRHRAEILDHARSRAALPPGLFTMTVPTGGGKTLAGLAFALHHAIRHGLDRVVYVIPYTSIIEQTADVFRRALIGHPVPSDRIIRPEEVPHVLEHTGAVDWDGIESDADGRDALQKLRRAAENWDVPVVVTTAVQFFESLHASRPARCRKLHNLARSVIVLDEAQTLPVPLLRPCMAALDELAAGYGASVVLCTATQPALRAQDGFKGGFDIPDERELAPDPRALYDALRRVTVRHAGAMTDADLAERFAGREQMLCIVNSRRHAQELYRLIAGLDGARHLTTLMCPAHRRRALAEMRKALKDKEPVRLVSTSLIEAGVDVDFPQVWRAENGLDSVAQSAGRCNREGRLADATAFVFKAADHKLPAMFNQQVGAMAAALRLHPDDPLGLEAVRAYFRQLYWTKGEAQLDAARLPGGEPFPILPALAASWSATTPPAPPFATIARAFRMVDDPGRPVIVPWRGGEDADEVARLVEALRHAPVPPGAVLRRLGQFTVTIPERSCAAMLAAGAIQPIAPERYADRFMLVQDVGLYSAATGLSLDPFGDAWMGAF